MRNVKILKIKNVKYSKAHVEALDTVKITSTIKISYTIGERLQLYILDYVRFFGNTHESYTISQVWPT